MFRFNLPVILVCLSFLIVLPALSQVEGNFWNGGGIRIGDSITACDATIEGAIRYNNTSNVHQFCNGAAWSDYAGGASRYALTDGATIAVDWNNGTVQSVTLGGNRTFTFANGQDGGRYILIIKQDGTGSRTATWPVSVRWGGGLSPVLTTTATKTDYIGFIYNGVDSTYDGVSISKNF